jgi:cardiolipin synthase A/B
MSFPIEQAPATERERPIVTAAHTLLLLPAVDLMLHAVFRDIERAEARVYIECYICIDDKLGTALGEALVRAASRGVRTRLLYDALGSHRANGEFFEKLRARGVDVRAYRPAKLAIAQRRFTPRDHSRIMVVDGAAYTGGAAWADEWMPESSGGGGWHDVCVRVVGPCVEDFARVFDQRWKEACGEADDLKDVATKDKYPDLELVADTPEHRNLVYLRHREAIRRAKRRVWIENSYFLPPAAMLQDLYGTVEHGAGAEIILPSSSDLSILKRAARSQYMSWLDHGLSIWEYEPRMLHSKFAVIDDDWCTIGTFNANITSLGMANEVNLFIFDPAFVARVARLFERDRAQCNRVTRETALSRTLLQQVGDSIAGRAMSTLDALLGRDSG